MSAIRYSIVRELHNVVLCNALCNVSYFFAVTHVSLLFEYFILKYISNQAIRYLVTFSYVASVSLFMLI